MKLFVLSAMAGAAAAFAPTSTTPRTSTAVKVSEQELGAIPPLGYFDPLGYITDEDKFIRYRAIERKHGRIAMVAFAGDIVHNNKWVFDGYLSPSTGLKFSDVDTGIGGLFQVPAAGLLQILLICGLVELAWWPASQLDGDYGIRLGTLNNWDAEPGKEERQKNAELMNGRAAMMAVFGLFVQEVVTGQNLAEQAAAGHFSPFGDGQGFF
jgi:hypothetical protein